MQHSSISPLAPIPARVVPNSWEDLASYITRVATEMGYRNPGWILHPEGVVTIVQPYNLCRLSRETDYQFFEHLLCMDEEAIYSHTLHRFTPCLYDTEDSRPSIPEEIKRPLLTQYMFQSFFHPYSATKVCSVCLTEEPAYGRLYWSVLPVVVCLHHRVFLTDRCPTCQSPIPLLRPSLSNCPRCHKGDYREAPIVHIPENPLFQMGQELILHNLGVQRMMNVAEVADTSKTPLLRLLPCQYFLLLDAFRCILGPLFPDAPFLQVSVDTRPLLRRRPRSKSALSLLEWSVIIATAHWLCTSWPDNFFSFLDVFPHARSERRRKRDRQRASGLQRDFGVFYEKWLYQRLAHPAFAFLHEAFESYLEKHYTGGELTKRLQPFKGRSREQLQERPYLTKAQTKAIMGIGEDVLQALLVHGSLRCLKKPIGRAGKRTMFLIERESVESVQREWAGLLPLDSVARSHLGVSKGVLLEIEQAGLLKPARGPWVDGYKFRLFKAADIEQFSADLLGCALSAPLPVPEHVTLSQAACVLAVPMINLLTEVLNGYVKPIDLGTAQPLLQRLVLTTDEIRRYRERRAQQRRDDLGLLTTREASASLGVDHDVLLRWVKHGFLTCEKMASGGSRFSLVIRQEALKVFQHTYISTEATAELLGIVPGTVRKYVRKGVLRPVTGRHTSEGGNRLLFLREQVESLAPTDTVTAHDAAALLGLSCSRVYALIRAGKLQPIRLPKGISNSTRLPRSDVVSYRSKMRAPEPDG